MEIGYIKSSGFFPGVEENSQTDSNEGIRLLPAQILRGHNFYHCKTVIRQEVVLGGLANFRSKQAGPDFASRFSDRFLRLKTQITGTGKPVDFLERLNSTEGTSLGDVLLNAMLAVETAMAFTTKRLDPIEFSQLIEGDTPEHVVLVWNSHNPAISQRAAEIGFIGVAELLRESLDCPANDESDAFEAAYCALSEFSRKYMLTHSTTLVVQAAEKRGIPWEPITRPFIRLGQGKFQSHLWKSQSSKTSDIARRLAGDKIYTRNLLADLGLPVPRQVNVASAEEATAAAEAIGYPVVVKPRKGQLGLGVSAGLQCSDEVPSAFVRAQSDGSGVIVESFFEGEDHRLLVIEGRFVAAAKRIPPIITGDGVRTIGALIDELNADPYRDDLRRKQVYLDEELKRLLERAGYDFDTVLEKDEAMALRSTANCSTGGVPVDFTDIVHPDNCEMAILAAEGLGLDVAGIDFMTTDINRSYKEVGGGIIEVNSRPGFRPHTWPGQGEPRDAAGAVIEALYPPGNQGRIPIALIAGHRGLASVARVLNRVLRSMGTTTGLLYGEGGFVDGKPVGHAGMSKHQARRSILRNPRVEALVETVAPATVVRRGLGHECCDAAAIMDQTTDDDIEEVRKGLGVVARSTRGKLVIGAENALALELASSVDPNRVILVSTKRRTTRIQDHLDVGGQAVLTRRDQGERFIVLLEGENLVTALRIQDIPTLPGENSRRRVETLLFAVGLAYAMGLSGEEILSAIQDADLKLKS